MTCPSLAVNLIEPCLCARLLTESEAAYIQHEVTVACESRAQILSHLQSSGSVRDLPSPATDYVLISQIGWPL